jgi:hypothetical protein
MIAQLRNDDLITDLLVNSSMLRANTARPITLQGMFEWFWFANTAARIAL